MFLHRTGVTGVFATVLMLAVLLPGAGSAANSDKNRPSGAAPVAAGTASEWLNPETGKSIEIPQGWTLAGSPEQPFFYNRDGQAMLNCEPQTIQYVDLAEYAGVVRFMLSFDYELADFVPGAEPETMVSHGKGKRGEHLATVLTAAGSRFCRVDYVTDEAGQQAEFTDPVLSRALFASVGDIGLPPPAQASAWTNPDTGITITLPAGWIDQTEEEATTFRKGSYFAVPACNWAIPEGINTLGDYANALKQSGSSRFNMSPFRVAETETILISTGFNRETMASVTMVVSKAGTLYCSIIYGQHGSGTDLERRDDPALSAVLFESIKQ